MIEDQLALRIAAYNFSEAGYIDIVSSPDEDAIAADTGTTAIVKDDSNSSTNKGVRASLLWQPTENLKVGLVYGTQKNEVDNGSFSLASLSGYQVSYLNTPDVVTTDMEYSNLVIEYDIGWGRATCRARNPHNVSLVQNVVSVAPENSERYGAIGSGLLSSSFLHAF